LKPRGDVCAPRNSVKGRRNRSQRDTTTTDRIGREIVRREGRRLGEGGTKKIWTQVSETNRGAKQLHADRGAMVSYWGRVACEEGAVKAESTH